jgi:hypothetical protein
MENWKKFIKEQEEEDFSSQIGDLLSREAEYIIQGIEMAGMLGLSVEEVPFEKMDLSKSNVSDYGDLLRIAEVALEYYEDDITSYLRRHLKKAMEKGIRRRLEMGMTTGFGGAASTIRSILKNELTAHQRKINVIGAKE